MAITMTRARKRAGRTTNVSVSLDVAVLKALRKRADSIHGGNLSAAIGEAAEVMQRHLAREYVAQELGRGRPALTDHERREIDAELIEGWRHARRMTKKRGRAA